MIGPEVGEYSMTIASDASKYYVVRISVETETGDGQTDIQGNTLHVPIYWPD